MKKQATILFRFLIIIFKTNPKIVIGNFLLRILSALLPIVTLWIGKLIIDAINEHQPTQLVLSLIVIEACCGVLLLISNRVLRFFNELVNQKFSINISSQIIKHANEFSIEELEDTEFYNLMSRAVDETENSSEMIEHILDDIELIISIVVYVSSIAIFNAWIVVLFLMSIIPSVIGEHKFYKKFYQLRKSWTDNRREIDYLTWLSTTDVNMKEIKIFHLSDYLVEKLSKRKKEYFTLQKNLRKRQVLICGSLAVVSLICYYLAYAYVAYTAIIGTITIGTLVYLAAVLRNINSSFTGLFSSLTWLSYKAMYINDFFLFMDKKPAVTEIEHFSAKGISRIERSIELKDVGYKHKESDNWVFRHINLTIPAGQKMVILGANGSGKTTLLKVITGLYQPTEGQVLIDGVDANNIENRKFLFGMIFQDYIKYEFTAKENIGISNLTKQDDLSTIEKCAKESGAFEIIRALPLKWNQVLSNRFRNGTQLSGGEWQKVAVARALFSERPVLILDEPTASLDILSEKKLFEQLLSNYSTTQNKTIILVSHRLSQIKDIERIILLGNGSIMGDGTHQDLLKSSELYRNIYDAYVNG
ncbi:MAG: ABC transporter ATP-binding protein [Bacteroidales bacterium]|nr:ABC transporter ATP-binding protein [Bacteroidales bacterium]